MRKVIYKRLEEEEDDPSTVDCICGFTHDDGFSIACDDCACWVHARCYGINPTSIPDDFYCVECEPRPVDRERAVREMAVRMREIAKWKAYLAEMEEKEKMFAAEMAMAPDEEGGSTLNK